MNGNSSFSDCELAFTSFDLGLRIFKCYTVKKYKIHITQKPIDLYRRCLLKFAKKGDKILDTHGGSMSSAIACDMEGFDLDICEIDTEYYNKGKKRFENYKRQLVLGL